MSWKGFKSLKTFTYELHGTDTYILKFVDFINCVLLYTIDNKTS